MCSEIDHELFWRTFIETNGKIDRNRNFVLPVAPCNIHFPSNIFLLEEVSHGKVQSTFRITRYTIFCLSRFFLSFDISVFTIIHFTSDRFQLQFIRFSFDEAILCLWNGLLFAK